MAKLEIRRPQLTEVFGIGAVYDAPGMSLMISQAGWTYERTLEVAEPRLVVRLGVDCLRTPRPDGEGRVPARRFPAWCHCPVCGSLRKAASVGQVNRPTVCPNRNCGGVGMLPTRLIIACSHGHIDDFPWFNWAHARSTCTLNGDQNRLKLESSNRSTAFSDLRVVCACGASNSLEGVLLPGALGGIGANTCTGAAPWAGPGVTEECGDQQVKVLQRGASNVYFPIRDGAVSIPPYSGVAYQVADKIWSSMKVFEPGDAVWSAVVAKHAKANNLKPEELEEALAVKRREVSGLALTEDIKLDEFAALAHPPQGTGFRDHYHAVKAGVPRSHSSWLKEVTLVKRLRFVTALRGFRRIEYSTDDNRMRKTDMTFEGRRWMLANEVRGEGIFLQLDEAKVAAWLANNRPQIEARLGSLLPRARVNQIVARTQLPARAETILLHTLSHMVIAELALESGYSASSIRERLYCLTDASGAANRLGILIYTSTSDSEGSLGGLVRQGAPERLEGLLDRAIESARWCSNDPLCAEVDAVSGQGTGGLNLAACHCCSLLPETSCELFNVMLDRTLLVGGKNFPSFIS